MNLDLHDQSGYTLFLGDVGLDSLFHLPADDYDESEWSKYSGEEMADMLSELLMKFKFMGQRLSANDVCSLAFFCIKNRWCKKPKTLRFGIQTECTINWPFPKAFGQGGVEGWRRCTIHICGLPVA